MSIGTVSQDTLDAVRKAMAAGPTVAPNGDILQKDASTAGITVATGIYGVNLEGPSKKLFPVPAILRGRFARVAGFGSAVSWKG